MRVLTTEKLSPRRELTPEGFLLCRDVPIMRTGELLYGPGELKGIMPDQHGLVRVTRDEATVFDPLTMASFQGKPITIGHVPGHIVDPKMAKSVSVGTMLNPKRGTGADSDALMVDFLITDHETIDRLTNRSNPRYIADAQVSPSYTAVYMQDSDKPGLASQNLPFMGNSSAIVPRGRGGPTCAIGDEELIPMSKFAQLKNTILAAIRTGDAEGAANALNEAERQEATEAASRVTVVNTSDAATAQILAALESLGNRLGALEVAETNRTAQATADAAAAEAARTATATADAAMATRYPVTRQTEIASAAEILAPGVKLAQPTGDAATDMLGLQRAALAAAVTGDLKDIIAPMVTGVDLATADAAVVDPIFATAASVRAKLNNAVPNTVARAPGAGNKTPAQMMQEGIDAAWASK
jgi:hypothetical protein